MTVIERVARAICASVGKDPDAPFKDKAGRPMDLPEWHRWEGEARAAIAAMQEPTEAMIEAGFQHTADPCWPENVAKAWNAMIAAALMESSDV